MVGFVGVIERNDGVITIIRVYGRKDKVSTIQPDSTAMLQSVRQEPVSGKRDKGSGAGNPWVNQPGPDADDATEPSRNRLSAVAVGPGGATAAVAVG